MKRNTSDRAKSHPAILEQLMQGAETVPPQYSNYVNAIMPRTSRLTRAFAAWLKRSVQDLAWDAEVVSVARVSGCWVISFYPVEQRDQAIASKLGLKLCLRHDFPNLSWVDIWHNHPEET